MGGVLLATVPSPVRTFNPNLGLLYLAASLRSAGVEVRLLDLASLYGSRDLDTLISAIIEQKPEILGFNLLTENALYAYDIVESLSSFEDLCIVAGGPHPTSEPLEVLKHGFDVVVLKEGEETLVELVQKLRASAPLSEVKGVAWLDEDQRLQHSPLRDLPDDLDVLPSPLGVIDLYDRDRYVKPGSPLLPPIITSRGCPGRCTFCSNNVSGCSYRFHSTNRVIEEVKAWQEKEGVVSLFFQDTAFTADRERTIELCNQLKEVSPRVFWVCKARCDQMDSELAKVMSEAGCTSIFFGVESGSDEVLKRVGKGMTVGKIVEAVKVAHSAGLGVYVHMMVGFPDETVEELQETARLMERLAPLVKGFPAGGVLLPYPGTSIYKLQHEKLGCTSWWLNRSIVDCINVSQRGPGGNSPTSAKEVVAVHAAIEKAFLDAKVIPYSKKVTEAIKECLQVRRSLNQKIMEGEFLT